MNFVKKHKLLLLVVLFSLISSWTLFRPGYFSHHDNMQFLRVFEMRKCITDLQIPCRWNQEMANGYGQPMFNYYSFFPYYVGALLSFFIGFLWSVKLMFLIPQILAGISMYLFTKELTGKKNIALASSVVYIFAPYHALDLYIRGALAESFAFGLLPLLFYFSYKLVKNYTPIDFTGLSLSIAFFATTHNITTLISIPVFLIWCVMILILKGAKNLISLVLSVLLGFGISSFFLIPAFFEKSLIKSYAFTWDSLDFRVHFVSLKQLFLDRFWGYGASVLGINDTISFQIGIVIVLICIFSIILFVIQFFIRKNKIVKGLNRELNTIFLFFILLFFAAAFMTHFRSAFIWEILPLLWYVQFPWRFLILVVFSGSVVVALFLDMFKENYQLVGMYITILFAVILNISYFSSDKYFDLTSKDSVSGDYFKMQQGGALWDYMPHDASVIYTISNETPKIINGEGVIENYSETSDSFNFKSNITRDAIVEIPIYDFPKWVIMVDGKEVEHTVNENGLMVVSLNLGDHWVQGRFENTSTRNYSNIISLLSIILLIGFIYGKNKKVIK